LVLELQESLHSLMQPTQQGPTYCFAYDVNTVTDFRLVFTIVTTLPVFQPCLQSTWLWVQLDSHICRQKSQLKVVG